MLKRASNPVLERTDKKLLLDGQTFKMHLIHKFIARTKTRYIACNADLRSAALLLCFENLHLHFRVLRLVAVNLSSPK